MYQPTGSMKWSEQGERGLPGEEQLWPQEDDKQAVQKKSHEKLASWGRPTEKQGSNGRERHETQIADLRAAHELIVNPQPLR